MKQKSELPQKVFQDDIHIHSNEEDVGLMLAVTFTNDYKLGFSLGWSYSQHIYKKCVITGQCSHEFEWEQVFFALGHL